MISNPSIKRLLWKDYREYSGLWWAMLVGALLFFWVIVAIEAAQRPHAMNTSPVFVIDIAGVLWFGIALCFPAAIGATSFSREHEQETYVFLRSLPIHSRTVLLCRAALVAVGTVLLFVFFFGAAAITSTFSSRLGTLESSSSFTVGMLVLSMLVAAEAFLIGVFFSLLTKHPLGALLMTGVTMMLIHGTALSGSFYGIETEVLAWQFLVLVSSIAFGILDYIRIPQWFREGDAFGSGPASAFSSNRSASKTQAHAGNESSVHRTAGRGVMRGLIWQQWRQLGLWNLFAVAFGLLILLLPNGLGVFGTFIALVLVASSVFFHEKQNRRYRFLSQRGVHPFKVWLARNVILLPVIAIPCACTACWIYWQAPEPVGQSCFYAFAPLIVFAVVQFCILATEQYIVGLVIAFLAAGITIGWCMLAGALGLPIAIGFVPLMVGSLAASYKRLADLLNEKNLFVHKSIAWSILIASMLVTITGTAFYRVYSIPATNGKEAKLVDVYERMCTRTDAQVAAFERFQIAASDITSTPTSYEDRFHFQHVNDLRNPVDEDEDGYIDDNNDLIPDTFQAPVRGDWVHSWAHVASISSQEDAWLADNSSALMQVVEKVDDPDFEYDVDNEESALFVAQHHNPYDRTILLLVSGARSKAFAGDLDGALAGFKRALKLTSAQSQAQSVHEWISMNYREQMTFENLVWWAGHKDQTKENVVALMEWLAARSEQPPSPLNALAADYVRYRSIFSDADQLEQSLNASVIESTLLTYRFMPWERTRSRRLYDRISVQQHDWVLAETPRLRSTGPYDRNSAYASAPGVSNNPELSNTLVTNLVTNASDSLLVLAAELEDRRRATMWQLRLIAHRIEFGEYPESIEEVEKLVEFRETSLTTGVPFQYERHPLRPVSVTEPLGSYFVNSTSPVLVSARVRYYLP